MTEPLVCALGDLVEDVVVTCSRPIVRGADIGARVGRHRGGSAANVTAVVARLGGRARFAGRLPDDPTGAHLVEDLARLGVTCAGPRGGRAGTVVSIVEPGGERTMCSDRGVAAAVEHYDPAWIADATVLHLPYYSFTADPLRTVAWEAAHDARRRGILLSVDPSSVTQVGDDLRALLREVRPDVLLANEDEAQALHARDGLEEVALTVVKQGPGPVRLRGSAHAEVPAPTVPGPLDTTGAGDAFAGGFLLALARGADPVAAAGAGHAAAARVIRGPGADAWSADPVEVP